MQVDSPFGLSLPPDFDEQKVVLSQVEEFRNTLNLKTIIHYNLNWVAGGAILGRLDVLHKFCLKYLQFINTSLKLRMIGAEQQMIYAMYSGNLNKQEEDIQICNKGWFCLGHLAVATWFQNNGIKSKINKWSVFKYYNWRPEFLSNINNSFEKYFHQGTNIWLLPKRST